MIMKEQRRAAIFQHGRLAGHLHSIGAAAWAFAYEGGYDGPPVSLTLPVRAEACDLPVFPAFLEGLLHETILAGILADLRDELPKWEAIIRRSFLSPPAKTATWRSCKTATAGFSDFAATLISPPCRAAITKTTNPATNKSAGRTGREDGFFSRK